MPPTDIGQSCRSPWCLSALLNIKFQISNIQFAIGFGFCLPLIIQRKSSDKNFLEKQPGEHVQHFVIKRQGNAPYTENDDNHLGRKYKRGNGEEIGDHEYKGLAHNPARAAENEKGGYGFEQAYHKFLKYKKADTSIMPSDIFSSYGTRRVFFLLQFLEIFCPYGTSRRLQSADWISNLQFKIFNFQYELISFPLLIHQTEFRSVPLSRSTIVSGARGV